MAKCSVDESMLTPIGRAIEYAKQSGDKRLVRKLKELLNHETEVIKSAYADGVDFVIMGIMAEEDWPSADEYFEELFTP